MLSKVRSTAAPALIRPSLTFSRRPSAGGSPQIAKRVAPAARSARRGRGADFHSNAPALAAYVLPYKAPLRDMNFTLNETLNAPAHYAKLGFSEELGAEDVDGINQAAATFAEEVARAEPRVPRRWWRIWCVYRASWEVARSLSYLRAVRREDASRAARPFVSRSGDTHHILDPAHQPRRESSYAPSHQTRRRRRRACSVGPLGRRAAAAAASATPPQVLAPMYATGDAQGCMRDEAYPHDVTTPTGFKEAFEMLAEQGWQGQ